MKGITHFSAGIAWASCFPHAVDAAAAGNPAYFVLGGALGLLPDTVDFKWLRFFYRHDMEVVPDPNRPDPLTIAKALAHAIGRASATGRSVRIKINTTRAGAGLWHQYHLFFDLPARKITVRFNGVVTTSREPAPLQPHASATASVPLECDVALDYTAGSDIDIFEGPVFSMDPVRDGRICARFIPWHRQWSHSLTGAVAVGTLTAWLWNGTAGLIAGGALALHVLADQAGFMGSNLLYPFMKRRTPGLQWLRSDNAVVNFAVVWISALLTYWNLARVAPVLDAVPPLPRLLVYGAVLPLAGIVLLSRLFGRPVNAATAGGLRRRTGTIKDYRPAASEPPGPESDM